MMDVSCRDMNYKIKLAFQSGKEYKGRNEINFNGKNPPTTSYLSKRSLSRKFSADGESQSSSDSES